MEIRVTDLNKSISGVLAKAQDEDVVILKHGKPVAVLIGVEAYQALLGTKAGQTFATAYDFFATLPGVNDFEVERESFELQDVAL